MARGKVYDLAIKIAGRVDSSLKKACLDADEQLGELAKTAEKIGKAAKVAAGVTTAAIGAVGVASVKAYTEHQQAANSMAAATGAAGEQLECRTPWTRCTPTTTGKACKMWRTPCPWWTAT